MELNLHPIATKCFVSNREFAEGDRVVSYLLRPATDSTRSPQADSTRSPQAGSTRSPQAGSTGSPQAGPGASGEAKPTFVRCDLLESEDSPAFSQGDFSAVPDRGTDSPTSIGASAFVYCRWVTASYKPRRDDNSDLNLKLTAENLFLTLATPSGDSTLAQPSALNTPLLQFLALMLERKKLIKLRGLTEDGARQIYEHMPSHQLYEVPVGDLNVEFFQKIQEHLGVLVGTPKPKVEAPAQPVPAAAS